MSDYTIPAADVVSRDCYDRILAENDELREQLNTYRATGLSPERVAEYAQADREGRYIVLKEPERAGVERLIEIAQADREGRLVIRRERLTNADKIRTMTTDEALVILWALEDYIEKHRREYSEAAERTDQRGLGPAAADPDHGAAQTERQGILGRMGGQP